MVDLILYNTVVPAVNQVEAHPFHQRVAEQAVMREYGVQIEAWGPFAEGKKGIFQNAVLSDIAERYGKTVAQVILRWLTQREIVAIPKSVRPERMAENFNIFDFELIQGDMETIATLETGASAFFDHRDPNMVKWISERKIHDWTGRDALRRGLSPPRTGTCPAYKAALSEL